MTKKRIDRGNGRDAKGRWIKGTSGNLNGRPRKVADLDFADVHNFSQYPMEIVVGGEKQLMTRHEIVLLKAFESALRGRITAQRYLIEKFEEAENERGYIDRQLELWEERIAEDPSSATSEVMQVLEMVLRSRNGPHSKIRTRQVKRPRNN